MFFNSTGEWRNFNCLALMQIEKQRIVRDSIHFYGPLFVTFLPDIKQDSSQTWKIHHQAYTSKRWPPLFGVAWDLSLCESNRISDESSLFPHPELRSHLGYYSFLELTVIMAKTKTVVELTKYTAHPKGYFHSGTQKPESGSQNSVPVKDSHSR